MVIEAGERTASTFKYLQDKSSVPYEPVYSDGQARFFSEYKFDIIKLEPWCPIGDYVVVPRARMHAFFGCAFHGGWAQPVIADAFLIMYVWLALRDIEAIRIEMHRKVLLAWILGLDKLSACPSPQYSNS